MNKRTIFFIVLLFIFTAAMAQPIYEENVPYDATHYLNGYQQCYFYMHSNEVDVYPTIGNVKHEFRFGSEMKEKFYYFFFSGNASNEQKSTFLQRLLDECIHFPPPNSSFFSPDKGLWEPFYGYTNILIHNINNDLTWLVPEYFRCNIKPTDDGIIFNVINSQGSILFTFGTDQRNQLAYYLNSELGKQEKSAYLHKFIEAELKSPSSTTSIVPAGQDVMQNYAEYIDNNSSPKNVIDKVNDKVTINENETDDQISYNKSGIVNKTSGTKTTENNSSGGSGGILGFLIILYVIYKVANRKKNKKVNRTKANVYSGLSDYNHKKLEEKEQKDRKEHERQKELERKKKETERKEKERRRREDEERDRERRDREKRQRREEERRKKEYEDRLYDEYRRQQGL